MTAVLRALIGAVAIAATAPAFGQAASVKSTSDSVSRQQQGLVDGARELKRLANCTYKRRQGYVNSLLDTPPNSAQEFTILDKASNVAVNCMNSMAPAIYFDGLQMRGALAEARYVAENPSAPDFSELDHAMIAIPAHWTEREMSDAEKMAILKFDFANCLVAADPLKADLLLRTEPATPEESAAVRQLTPQLAPCLQNGVKFKLDAYILRALLAQSLERSTRQWAASARATSGAATENAE